MEDHSKELSLAYQKLKREKKRIPYASEFPSRYWAISKYGSWNAFVNHEEHEQVNRHQNNYITKEQLIWEIRQINAKLHYPPHPKNYNRTVTAINRFGSWRKFLAAAGIQATYPFQERSNSFMTLEEIDYRIKEITAKHDGKLTDHILREEGFPIATVYDYFGSMKALKNHYHLIKKQRH